MTTPQTNTSVALTHGAGTSYPPTGEAQNFTVVINNPTFGGNYDVRLIALPPGAGDDVTTIIRQTPVATKTVKTGLTLSSRTANLTHTPTTARHTRYVVTATYTGVSALLPAGDRRTFVSNIIPLWPGLRLTGGSIVSQTALTVGETATLVFVSMPLNAPNLTIQYQRRVGSSWENMTRNTYSRSSAGSEQFRATVTQQMTGGGGPIVTDAITVTWSLAPTVTISAAPPSGLNLSDILFETVVTLSMTPANIANPAAQSYQFFETQDANDLTPDSLTTKRVGGRSATVAKSDPGTWYFSGVMTTTDGDEIPTTNRAIVTWNDLARPAPTAAAGNAQVTLTWAAVDHATGYRVRWATLADIRNRGSAAALNAGVTATSPHVVTGLTNGTEYEFYVHAVFGTHNGPAGTVRATPASTVDPTVGELIAHWWHVTGVPGASGTVQLTATQYRNAQPVSGATITYRLAANSPAWISLSGNDLTYTLPTPSSYPLTSTGPTSTRIIPRGRRYAIYEEVFIASSSTPGVADDEGFLYFYVMEPAATAQPLVAADITLTVVAGGTVSGTMGFVSNQDGAGAPHRWNIASPLTWLSTAPTNPTFTARNVPIAGQPHRLTYTVSDADGNVSAAANITINVTPAPTGFAIDGPTTVNGQVGEPVPAGLVWITENAQGAVTWTVPTNLPAGVTLTRSVVGGVTQYTAGGTFRAAVTDVVTAFSARDSSTPPQNDTHNVTWNVTPLPTVATTAPTIRITIDTVFGGPSPIRERTINGVRHYWFRFGDAPELLVTADNLDVGQATGTAFDVSGPPYSMNCAGGRRGLGLTSVADLQWNRADPVNAVGGAYQYRLITSGSYWFLQNYGSPRVPFSGYALRNDRLIVQNPPTGQLIPSTPTTNVPDLLYTEARYIAKLYDHRHASRLFRVPVYTYSAASQEFVRNSRGDYREYRNNRRQVAIDEIVIHWEGAPLRWLRTQQSAHLRAGNSAPAIAAATGGVPPYRYRLHGDLPAGLSVAGDTTDRNGNRIAGPSTGAPVVTGRVSATELGRYPMTLICHDSAAAGQRQIIRQDFVWRVVD